MTYPLIPIRRIFRVINGGTPSADPANWGGETPWATPADLRDRLSWISSTARNITALGAASGSTIVPTGSLIISTRAPIGKVSIAGCNLAFNQGCRALIPTEALDVRYYGYQLESINDELNSRGLGTTFTELSSDSLASIKVHHPKLSDQQRIADFLDTETAHIDALCRARSQQLDALEERTHASMSETLLPGILTSPLGAPPYPWLPSLPADMPLVKLGFACTLQNGLTVDANRRTRGDSVTRPYLRVANVQAGHLDLDEVAEITVPLSTANRCTLQVGDVLMTEGGDLDKLGRGTVWNGELPECLHQNHVFALRPDKGRLLGEYLALMTQTLHGRCYFESTGSKTTNLASTNSSKILAFKLPLPGMERQRILVDRAKKALDGIKHARALLVRQSNLLTERRQALIIAAVTGQFDVSTASGRGIED